MKPIFQTIFGSPNGNCLATCVASIFELPLDGVPNFIQPDPKQWLERLNEWLKLRGYMALCVTAEGAPGAISIACGRSPRGAYDHCVVWRNGEMIHDPHPDGTGILSKDDWTYFIKLDPV